MRKIIIILVFGISVLAACKKPDDSSFSDAVITGVDYRKCMCCSGYFITIDTLQYRFFNIPDTTEIKLENAVFPIPVKLKWKKMVNTCTDLIEVIQINKR